MTYPTKPHDWSKNPPKVGDTVRVWGYGNRNGQIVEMRGEIAVVVVTDSEPRVLLRPLSHHPAMHATDVPLLNCFPVEEEPVELPDERKGERRYGQGFLWFLSTDPTSHLRPNVSAPGYFVLEGNILHLNRRIIYSDRRAQNLGRKGRKA